VGLAAALFFARGEGEPPDAGPTPSAQRVPLEPLSADGEIVSLAVPGTDGARVSVPTGAAEPRGITIVLHADGERGEEHCKIWRRISAAHEFVLCPQFAPQVSTAVVSEQLRGALRALKERFGSHVGSSPVVLAGFGSGAEHAVQIAREEPSFFARLMLVNGGYSAWSATSAAAFEQRGGQRLVFACSDAVCRDAIEAKLPVLRSVNLAVELLYEGELPGALDPRLVKRLSDAYVWNPKQDAPRRVPNPRGMVPE
jgi:hypothetical protein